MYQVFRLLLSFPTTVDLLFSQLLDRSLLASWLPFLFLLSASLTLALASASCTRFDLTLPCCFSCPLIALCSLPFAPLV